MEATFYRVEKVALPLGQLGFLEVACFVKAFKESSFLRFMLHVTLLPAGHSGLSSLAHSRLTLLIPALTIAPQVTCSI